MFYCTATTRSLFNSKISDKHLRRLQGRCSTVKKCNCIFLETTLADGVKLTVHVTASTIVTGMFQMHLSRFSIVYEIIHVIIVLDWMQSTTAVVMVQRNT